MAYQLHTHANAADAAQALAAEVAQALQQTVAEKGRAVLAVSGGRSPIAFFQALSQTELAWDKIAVALVDERIVPTNHADSNTGLVREYLLQNHAAAAEWIPQIEDGQTEASLNPQAALAFALQHYRQPDVLVLGMGADGHTASLFPQAPQLKNALETEAPLVHTTPVTAPHERISMALQAIAATPYVFLAIQGAEKLAVFEKAVETESNEYPIGLVLHHEGVNGHVCYAE